MKLFLRGVAAFGVGLIFTFAATAQQPAASSGANGSAPAATAQGNSISADCGCDCGNGSANRLLKGRFSRFGQGMGQRVDRLAECYIGVNQGISGLFQRLAGPPVEPVAGAGFGKHKGGPYTQPGTVVFPHHPFVRSPRDFFMMEQP